MERLKYNLDEKHIHLFLKEDGLYLLRTDGKAKSNPNRNEEVKIDFSPEVTDIIGTYPDGYKRGQLLPIMCAPIDIQMRWYNYLMDRRYHAGDMNDPT